MIQLSQNLSYLVGVAISLAPTAFHGQTPATQISAKPDRAVVIRDLRARYYRPGDLGLISFACSVKYQFDTLPAGFLVPAEVAGRPPLDATELLLTVDQQGQPTIKRTYGPDTAAPMKPIYDVFFGQIQNFITGFIQTWASKATRGPIPPDSAVMSEVTPPSEYLFRMQGSGMTIDLFVTHDLLVDRILTESSNQIIDEHPTFTSSPQGLLLTANDTSMRQGESSTHIHYDVDYQTVETVLLPHTVHLVVDDIDTRFSFEKCKVQRATMVRELTLKP